MEVFGVTTTMSMWSHFAGAFFLTKMFKIVLSKWDAFILLMLFGVLLEAYQLNFGEQYATIWWDSGIDLVMDFLGAYIAARWIHE